MVKAITVTALCLAAAAALGYVLVLGGGKPISTDLSAIGQGRPALVLAHENFSPTGGDALNRLRGIRSDYDARLEFAVADLGTPEGRAFADRHRLGDGLAVFLSRDGEPLQTTSIPQDDGELRRLLDAALATVD